MTAHRVKTRVRVYDGHLALILGLRWQGRRGYTVVGNVERRRRLFGGSKFTVTYQRGES